MKSSSKNLVKNGVLKFTIMSLLLVALLYILMYTPSNNLSKLNVNRDELEKVLAETSTQNKTVIITTINKAYCKGDKPMLDLFLDGFWIGENTRPLKDHLLIVAFDQTAYQRCKFLGLHCYRLGTDGLDLSGETVYMSKDYLEMQWMIPLFLGGVLKRGYNFLYTDTDIIWLRNPFIRLSPDEAIDLQISTDSYSRDDKWNIDHLNAGFFFTRSNNKTITFFDLLYLRKDSYPGVVDHQNVLVKLLHEKEIRDLGIKVKYLDTNYFSGFCQNSKDVRSVVTFHTNCCRSISAKLADLTTMIHDWKRYKGLSASEAAKFKFSKFKNCGKSWDN